MKLSELKETLEQRENYFQNLQNLEKLLENDEALAKKIEAKGEFTMPVHDVVTYARMAYYDGKIAPIKKVIAAAEREIEVDMSDRLISEEKYQEKDAGSISHYAPDSFHEEIFTPKDTYPDMPVETFVSMLKDRGFICGCNKKLEVDYWIGKKEAEWNVYYQPETGFIMPLMVKAGANINYFGGIMATQRKDFVKVHDGNYNMIMPFGDDETRMYTNDIKEDLFAWYDQVCTGKPCLEWKTGGRYLDMGMDFMDAIEKRYHTKCCEQLQICDDLAVFIISQNICTLNNMELFDEGLKKMTAQVKSDLGFIITNSINECANFKLGHEKTRQVLAYLLQKIGKDDDWLTKNGVDLEKAFLRNKDLKSLDNRCQRGKRR